MRRVAQLPAHFEVELRQPGTDWRRVRRVGATGIVPLKFASLEAAQVHAARLSRRETRVVAVERDGWRRVVDVTGI